MSFSSNGIWTVFCTEWFPESLVLHPHGIFKEIFVQAIHMSVSCNIDPSENNHGWNRKKCCATLFFWIRSLEITNILEFGFSPFPSFFDLLSKRNNIFFFWNRSCVNQYICASVKCTGLLQNNIFFWKGNCTEFFWSHWPTMQWQDGNLSFFLTDHCSPQLTETLSACSPLIALWVTAPLSFCPSKASPLSRLPENFFSQPLWPLRALYVPQPLALIVLTQGLCCPPILGPKGSQSSSRPPLPTFGSRTAAATVDFRACVAHGHRQTLCGQEKLPCLPPSQLRSSSAAPAVFSSPPSLPRAEGKDKDKGGTAKEASYGCCTSSLQASYCSCTHMSLQCCTC